MKNYLEWKKKHQNLYEKINAAQGEVRKAKNVADGSSAVKKQKRAASDKKQLAEQIRANKEFVNIKIIMGLKQGMKYKDVSRLRYGCIIILTDQDHDGFHIKGLLDESN